MPRDIQIGSFTIGPNHPPFVIAEMSGNHNQSLERALEIIDQAATCGVHALKIQTYTPDTMTIDMSEGEFFISDSKSLWKGKSLYQLYQEAHTPWDWHKAIFERCQQHGMLCFSTPFDASAVDFLEELNTPFYKIASFENTDLPLIKKVAQTQKPIIVSTGMASIGEINEIVDTIRAQGNEQIVLLKCTSAYPSPAEACNLNTIPHLQKTFDVHVGLSDHTLGIGVAIASVALGACVIEKHFTTKRSDGGVDSAFSMEPHEMKLLVEESKRAYLSLGKISYGKGQAEEKSTVFKRSLYITEDIKAGSTLNEQNLRCIRPGHGLSPKYYETLLGKKITKDLKKGTPVTWSIFE